MHVIAEIETELTFGLDIVMTFGSQHESVVCYLIAEPTAPSVNPERGVVIPCGYLHPGKGGIGAA